MYLIAHRGNITGPNRGAENSPSLISSVLETTDYDCQIDLRIINGKLFLGHDSADYKVGLDFLLFHKERLWIHCKNLDALTFFRTKVHEQGLNYFWHDKDQCTITSRGFLWFYPSKKVYPAGINLLPELNGIEFSRLERTEGVCSDYIGVYKNEQD